MVSEIQITQLFLPLSLLLTATSLWHNKLLPETKVQRSPSFESRWLGCFISWCFISYFITWCFINYFRKVTDISHFPFLAGPREGQASPTAGAEWKTEQNDKGKIKEEATRWAANNYFFGHHRCPLLCLNSYESLAVGMSDFLEHKHLMRLPRTSDARLLSTSLTTTTEPFLIWRHF